MRRFITPLVVFALLPASALAADGPECFLGGRNNICAKAREIQAGVAPGLPLQVSREVRLTGIVAMGPRITISAILNMTKAALLAKAPNPDDTAQQMADIAVCSEELLAAFIRLGGEIQFTYRSSDNLDLFSPVIRSCRA